MFKIGDRVRLTDVLHVEYRGLKGTVKKIVKSINIIDVICDNGKSYGAYPENVELL